MAVFTWPAERAFLLARGAGDMPHPGGTLLEHLLRTGQRLAEWDLDPDVQVAGVCHASYGTDGFDRALLQVAEHPVLAELIGDRAAALVYLYGSCDRGAVYPRLDGTAPVNFLDRFTGTERPLSEPDLRAFLAITVANELDVLGHNAELAARHGAALHRLFGRNRALLPPVAWRECERQLGGDSEAG